MSDVPSPLHNQFQTSPRFNPSFTDIGHFDGIQEISYIDSGCTYHSPPLKVSGQEGDSLNIIHVNIRSLPRNFDKLNALISKTGTEFDVICLSETWLEEPLANNFCIPGYSIINSCPDNYRGKGAAVLIKNNLVYHELPKLSVNYHHFQSVFIEIVPSLGPNIVLGTMYRSPSYEPKDFLDYFENIINCLAKTKKKCALAGDVNIDILKINESEIVDRYLACLIGGGFLPTITVPTRITATSRTLIDNIFINNFQSIKNSGVIVDDCSDHLPIFLIMNLPARVQHVNEQNVNAHLKTSVFDYRKLDTLARHVQVKLHDFLEVDDPEEGASYLIQTIHSELINLSTKRKKT